MSPPPTYLPTDPTADQPLEHQGVQVLELDSKYPIISYYQFRLTVPHSEEKKVRDVVLAGVTDYLMWPHSGKNANNMHFHILVPAPPNKFDDLVRKRAKTAFESGGNKLFAGKFFKNRLTDAVHYLKHEPTDQWQGVSNGVFDWYQIIRDAPEWTPDIGVFMTKLHSKKEIHPDHFKELTYRNLEKVTLRYRKENGISSKKLEDTLQHMFAHGWRFAVSVIRAGIPDVFYEEFHEKCNEATSWKASRFVMMRTHCQWRVSI